MYHQKVIKKAGFTNSTDLVYHMNKEFVSEPGILFGEMKLILLFGHLNTNS